MIQEGKIFDIKTGNPLNVSRVEVRDSRFIHPLQVKWNPKEDITSYELAQCLPYFLIKEIMPSMIDQSLPHFRHFEIIDPNK